MNKSDKEPDAVPADSVQVNSPKRSGRVTFDSRGTSVWEWQVKTGVYSRDVDTEAVRKLDLDGLSLADTSVVHALSGDQSRKAGSAQPSQKLEIDKSGTGFNPYDNAPGLRKSAVLSDPYDNARLRFETLQAKRGAATRSSGARKPVQFMKKPPTELSRPSGWSKLKRMLTGKRD